MTLTNKQQRFGSHRAETAVCHQNSFLAHTGPDLCLDSASIPCLALTGPLHRSVQTALHLHVLEPAGPEPAPADGGPAIPGARYSLAHSALGMQPCSEPEQAPVCS